MENRAFQHGNGNGVKTYEENENQVVKRLHGSESVSSPSLKGDGSDDGVKLKRTVGLFGSISLIVGTMIGSGIFISPGGIINNVGNVWTSLIIWALCGVLSMFGAITYIELSTVIPSSGAEYSYIMAAFGPVMGFLNSWAALTLLRPSQLAVICLTCAQNMVEPFVDDIEETNVVWGINIMASAIILILTYINCVSVRFATRVQVIFTVAKLVGIAVIVVAGAYKLFSGNTEQLDDPIEVTSNFGNIASAFFSGLWAYDGWNQLNLVAEEIKDPYKNLPRAIFIGIPLVTVCYILVNVAFFTVIKADEFGSGSVAILFGDRVLGVMSFLMPLCVVLSTFGAGNGVLFTSARITFVAGREGHLPDCISYVDVKRDTPSISLMFNSYMNMTMRFATFGTCSVAIISIVMVVALDVNGLIDFFSYSAWIFYGLAAATLVVFRYKLPDAPRPFKAPVWMSFIVVLMSLFLTIGSVWMDPRLGYLYSVLSTIAGIFLYLPFVHFNYVLPGMNRVTKFVQLMFQVVPADGMDEVGLIESKDKTQD